MPRVAVVGSVNLDLVATAPRLPRPGETVTDAEFERHPGGKGANQALAAARMGADVQLFASVGDDPDGTDAMALLVAAGVDCSAIRRTEHATGVALIAVDARGENQIVVAPGANRELRPEDVDATGADAVVCQLEIPVDVVAAAVGSASFSVLNCAPARELPAAVIDAASVIVVNETERRHYGSLLDRAAVLVTTRGRLGAVARVAGDESLEVPAPVVETVDTVGAGDTFVGALAVELAAGVELEQAVRIAVTAGALATTVAGAQPSIPTRASVLAAMGVR